MTKRRTHLICCTAYLFRRLRLVCVRRYGALATRIRAIVTCREVGVGWNSPRELHSFESGDAEAVNPTEAERRGAAGVSNTVQ